VVREMSVSMQPGQIAVIPAYSRLSAPCSYTASATPSVETIRIAAAVLF
jgi:hypothetical protein